MIACVWGSPIVPLVCNIVTIRTNLITNDTTGKEIGEIFKINIGSNGTNVTNQWYHWENPEHTQLSDHIDYCPFMSSYRWILMVS